MLTVGIITNPASGKDIRRLVSQSRVISNQEKINIVRRILAGLEASGVEKILLMPDYSNLSITAASEYDGNMQIESLDMPVFNNDLDTTRAAENMALSGASAIVALGGDGTSRAASKKIGTVPLMPVSTGTNNVFPYLIEGTLAGLATGYVVTGTSNLEVCAPKHKSLNIMIDSGKSDVALVDVAISRELFVGARAIWNIDSISELFLSIAEPASIGLSAIGGMIRPVSRTDCFGLHISLTRSKKGNFVTAPVTPGGLSRVFYSECALIKPGEEYRILGEPCIIALDGERTIPLQAGQTAKIEMNLNGPRVIDPYISLRLAAEAGYFCEKGQIIN